MGCVTFTVPSTDAWRAASAISYATVISRPWARARTVEPAAGEERSQGPGVEGRFHQQLHGKSVAIAKRSIELLEYPPIKPFVDLSHAAPSDSNNGERCD